MKKLATWPLLFLLLTGVSLLGGCSPKGPSQSDQPKSSTNAASPSTNSTGPQSTSVKGASIKADPNPIRVCDGSGLGVTTLTYTFLPPVQAVYVRANSPSGAGMAYAMTPGSSPTGKWVGDGTVFYLQDVSNGKSLTPDNTLATVTVNTTTTGCP